MKLCPKCAANISPEDKFCGMCGFEVISFKEMQYLTQKDIKVDDIRQKLGMVYYKMGKYEEALEIFQQSLEKNPDDKDAKEMVNKISSHTDNNK